MHRLIGLPKLLLAINEGKFLARKNGA